MSGYKKENNEWLKPHETVLLWFGKENTDNLKDPDEILQLILQNNLWLLCTHITRTKNYTSAIVADLERGGNGILRVYNFGVLFESLGAHIHTVNKIKESLEDLYKAGIELVRGEHNIIKKLESALNKEVEE